MLTPCITLEQRSKPGSQHRHNRTIWPAGRLRASPAAPLSGRLWSRSPAKPRWVSCLLSPLQRAVCLSVLTVSWLWHFRRVTADYFVESLISWACCVLTTAFRAGVLAAASLGASGACSAPGIPSGQGCPPVPCLAVARWHLAGFSTAKSPPVPLYVTRVSGEALRNEAHVPSPTLRAPTLRFSHPDPRIS